jgi:hypothetical protein
MPFGVFWLRVDRLERSGKFTIQPLGKENRIAVFGPPFRMSRFDYLLLESIDESLDDLLGSRSRDQIYDHLATQYTCGREDIPLKIRYFYEFLEIMFATASRTVGRTIIRRLSEKLGCVFVNTPEFEFFDSLSALRERSERDAGRREFASQAAF